VRYQLRSGALLLLVCAWFFSPSGDLGHLPQTARNYYLYQAKIWHRTDIPRTDILLGPPAEIAARPEQEVACQFIEPGRKMGGYSPKFKCRLTHSGDVVPVKYGSHEVYAEVAATRLLWALGFYADKDYPVKLLCSGCPEKKPSHPAAGEKRMDRVLNDAIIEEPFKHEISSFHDEGWAWQELDSVNVRLGGASQKEIDALKLLAVFLQHTDSKRAQQRIGCYPEDFEQKGNLESCKNPVLMIQDLGCTFGSGGRDISEASSMNLQAWKSQPVWNIPKETDFASKNPGEHVCFGNLTSADSAKHDGLFDPKISEAGRQFLANLMNQLSDVQIYDLFRVARADKTNDSIEVDGVRRPVEIEDWVSVFKDKRQQINHHRCS